MTDISSKGVKPGTGGQPAWNNDAARKTANREDIRTQTPPQLPARSRNPNQKKSKNERE